MAATKSLAEEVRLAVDLYVEEAGDVIILRDVDGNVICSGTSEQMTEELQTLILYAERQSAQRPSFLR